LTSALPFIVISGAKVLARNGEDVLKGARKEGRLPHESSFVPYTLFRHV
jgi:hypothetical protein